MEYRVIWEIDIEAKSPREAAEQALKIQRRHGSCAVVFDVYSEDDKHMVIDLDTDENEDYQL